MFQQSAAQFQFFSYCPISIGTHGESRDSRMFLTRTRRIKNCEIYDVMIERVLSALNRDKCGF